MKMTLRQARRLERAIETRINEVVQAGVHTRSVAVTVYQDFDEAVKNHNAQVLQAIEDASRLNQIRFWIRRAISAVHERDGLADLIAEEAMLRKQLGVIEGAISAEFTDNEHTIARARHHAAKTSATTQTDVYGRQQDQITLNTVMTKDSLDVLKNLRKSIEKRLRQIGDESSKLNTNSQIDVLEDDIAFVESHGIVV